MSTNISVERVDVRRQTTQKCFSSCCDINEHEHRLWLYASIDERCRWTMMWKLLEKENNKLNLIRVQCVEHTKSMNSNANKQMKPERTSERARIGGISHSFVMTSDRTFHFAFMEILACGHFPRWKCNISYLHSISIRSSGPTSAAILERDWVEHWEIEWVSEWMRMSLAVCWFCNPRRAMIYMIESI